MNDNKRMLLIDDLRNITVDRTARTYQDGIQALQYEGPWDILYLDHDLGNESAGTGYDVMCWLEEHTEFLPSSIEFVTGNPVGRQRMEMVREKLYKGEDDGAF